MSARTKNLVYVTSGFWGVLALFFSLLNLQDSDFPPYVKATIILGAMFVAMFIAETALCIKGNFGLIAAPMVRRLDVKRIMFKVTGWIVTISLVMSAYWIFPEYLTKFYEPYYKALRMAGPYLIGFFLFCIVWEDPRSEEETDGYYWLGQYVLCLDPMALKHVNLKQHFLAWVVKLYFLPLMFVYLVSYMNFTPRLGGVTDVYDTIYNYVFLIDTAFVSVGYIFANNLTDTNIRSTEPTLLGWVAALICYQPFWSVFGSAYMSYGGSWGDWLQGHPVMQTIWASLIILSLLVYVWATISFGTRFSNLTHRGILCCGPYAYMRHPAYVSKLVSFFLMYVPFIGKDFSSIFRSLVLWGVVAGVYYLRAKTEENHLRSVGPEYDVYCKIVDENWRKLFRRSD